ncbi:MAG: hypothetical protein QNJ63_12485 [Calothrix sp. MO_192.B10]|nr:hypothetical protein [Calothrix sp. MO_192.B10]
MTQSQAEQEPMIKPLKIHWEKVLGQKVEFLISSSYKDSSNLPEDLKGVSLCP